MAREWTLKEKCKFFMLENFKSHVTDRELNSTTLAEETINHFEIDEDNEDVAFDMAVDIIPRLKELGYIDN